MHNRLIGLDILRSVIMIFGPTFHAAMLYSGAWGFDYQLQKNEWLVDALNVTHPFRIGLFFILSGFFSSLLISKKGAEHFNESRKKRLLKPTLLAVLITLPLIALEMYFLMDDRQLRDYLSYKHLWFLIVLCQISLLVMLSPDKINRSVRRVAERLNHWHWVSIFALFAAAICASMVLIKVVNTILPHAVVELFQLGQLIQYIPYFIMGMLLFFMEKEINAKTAVALLALYFVWYLLSVLFEDKMKIALSLGKVFAVVAICLALFYLFKNVKFKENTFILSISKLALPFYLIHLPILIFLGWLWGEHGISRNPVLFLSYAVSLNILFSFLLSTLIVRSQSASRLMGLA
ncbi:acyltransferase family protein [[Erwinia] mediterraneensis]|uniref:acyltransferase family protein n=1 Tax=[Erwinia] mediterraneensis TaxID=2161819 RepID=UPI00103152AF|nr:acyltransferase family protein [[Erwinia] mediterraneensis]